MFTSLDLTTITFLGKEATASIVERSWRDEWAGSDGHPWWSDNVCTSYLHKSGLLLRRTCRQEMYTSRGDKAYHLATEDEEIGVVETNLDVWK